MRTFRLLAAIASVVLGLAATPALAGAATAPVAAYGFEETSGTTVADLSGTGNPGRTAGPSRTAGGRFGRALSFDGFDDWMTVGDADSLDLRPGITMSAWVKPSGLGAIARTVMAKEMPDGMVYRLYAGDGTGKPSGHVYTTADFAVTGSAITPLNTWTYLTTTWDRTTLRLFADGVEVASRPLTGTMRASGGPLRIGGNVLGSEFFAGAIDEIRIYNRALSLPEIQGDMAHAVP
jgi:hypothetical protein